MDNIDFEKLRKYLYDFYQSAYFTAPYSGGLFGDTAIIGEMAEIETCSEEDLLQKAIDMKINLDDFKVKTK